MWWVAEIVSPSTDNHTHNDAVITISTYLRSMIPHTNISYNYSIEDMSKNNNKNNYFWSTSFSLYLQFSCMFFRIFCSLMTPSFHFPALPCCHFFHLTWGRYKFQMVNYNLKCFVWIILSYFKLHLSLFLLIKMYHLLFATVFPPRPFSRRIRE